MIVSKYLSCTHCGCPAREYEGLEGGVYLTPGTPYECPKSSDGDHDFLEVKETEVKNECASAKSA